jgi:hypothetical protein
MVDHAYKFCTTHYFYTLKVINLKMARKFDIISKYLQVVEVSNRENDTTN